MKELTYKRLYFSFILSTEEVYMNFYSIEGNSYLRIKNIDIINLIGLPRELPKLTIFEINGRTLPDDTPVPMNFRSFKGLPNELPLLEHLMIYDSTIPNLESLTAKLPLLKRIVFTNCHLHNLKGFPKKPRDVIFIDCSIDSFEGLEVDNLNILDKSTQHLCITNTSFSSLHGISRTTLHSVLIEYFSRFGNFSALANLVSGGMERFNCCLHREIYDSYCPLEFIRRNLHNIYPPNDLKRYPFERKIKTIGPNQLIHILNEYGIEYPSQHWNEDKSSGGFDMEDWIYALDLEDQLFVPDKIDTLFEFYKKSPTTLALQYRTNPKSLPKDQIERLIYEADPDSLKILENTDCSNLQSTDPVIVQISRKFSVITKNGKIML